MIEEYDPTRHRHKLYADQEDLDRANAIKELKNMANSHVIDKKTYLAAVLDVKNGVEGTVLKEKTGSFGEKIKAIFKWRKSSWDQEKNK